MNHEQEREIRCEALSRRIAELDPDWAKPGMATMFHTATGKLRLRRTDHEEIRWLWEYGTPSGQLFGDREARLAGPDCTDGTTMGALLYALGPVQESEVCGQSRLTLWDGTQTEWFDTRTEAILAATIMQRGKQDT